MRKLRLIIRREYLAKVRNKSFIIMTFLSPLLMVGLIMLVVFLTQVNASEKRVIAVVNNGVFFQNAFKIDETTSYVHFKDVDLQTAKDSTIQLGYYGLLHIPKETTVEETAKATNFFTKEAPNTAIVGALEDIFQDKLREERLLDLGVTANQFASMGKRFELGTSTFEGQRNMKGINEIKAVIGGAFGYLIMMFIIIYGGFVMRSVIEEKTSRIIEVIISSIKPFQLMMGKIIGTALAGITQFTIWVISAGILLIVAALFFDIDFQSLSSTANLPSDAMKELAVTDAEQNEKIQLVLKEFGKIHMVTLVVSFLIYFVLGYLIYSSIYAAIGAAVDNETDTQQFMFPIILPLILAIYVGFFSVFGNPHGPIAVGFSLFPLTSPIVMLMRLPGGIGEGGVPLWQFITSILLLIGTFIGIVWLAAKIYRVGILMYGKKPTYKELFRWLKY